MSGITELRRGLHISPSQVSTYLRCPRQHRYRYVDGLEPEHKSANLILGSAVHAGVATWYRALEKGEDPPGLGELSDGSDICLDHELASDLPVRYSNGDGADELRQLAHQLLAVFVEQADVPDAVIAVEEAFSAPLIDPDNGRELEVDLVGVVDAVVEKDGQVWCVELKTAARRFAKDRLTWDLQPTIYLHGLRQLELDDVRVRFDVLLKTKTPAFVTYPLVRSPADEREALTTIVGVLHAIEAGVDYRIRGWQCDGCEYRRACDGGGAV